MRARLAHLRRLRAEPDRHRPTAVCRRALRCRVEADGLRLRLDDHRSVPVGVSVGAVSLDQGGGQAAHAARSARQHPDLHPHQRRQDARGQHPRPVVARAGRLLHHGSGLSRLRAAVPLSRGRQLLRHPRQVELSRSTGATRTRSTAPRGCSATRPSSSRASTRARAIRGSDAAHSIQAMPRPTRR